MDPIIVVSFVAGVSAKSLAILRALTELCRKYDDLTSTIAIVSTKITLVSTSLSFLQAWLLKRDDVTDAWQEGTDIASALDSGLVGCMVVLKCLENEIARVVRDSLEPVHDPDGANFSIEHKSSLVWDQDRMFELLESLKAQQDVIDSLLQILQLETLDDMMKALSQKQDVSRRSALQTASLRLQQPDIHVPDLLFAWHERDASVFNFGPASLESPTSFALNTNNVTIPAPASQRATVSVMKERKRVSTSSQIQAEDSSQPSRTRTTPSRGLPRCDERIMGLWAKYASRKLKLSNMRNEVICETPLISIGAVDVGFDSSTPVWHADGTQESSDRMRLPPWDSMEDKPESGTGTSLVTPRWPELATWIPLLAIVQRLESYSRNWEAQQDRNTPQLPPPRYLGVVVRPQVLRFDADSPMKKPYATLTLSDLITLASGLGIYWKQFDWSQDKYFAEGNGFLLHGSRIAKFGLVFTFEETGNHAFGRTRVVPTEEIKEISFGNVPTFYRQASLGSGAAGSQRRSKLRNLRLGSRKDIADTLTRIGCNSRTTRSFLDGKNTTHMFPVVFELLGMTGRLFHIEKSPFTYIPNPTTFQWDRANRSSLLRLLNAFHSNMLATLTMLKSIGYKDLSDLISISDLSGDLCNTLPSRVEEFSTTELDQLHKVLLVTDETLREDKVVPDTVLDVLRCHFQEVSRAINTSTAPGEMRNEELVSFEDLLSLPIEHRERRLMLIYFHEIRAKVTRIDFRDPEDLRTTGLQRHMEATQISQASTSSRSEDTSTDAGVLFPGRQGQGNNLEMERNTIWCTLVFRMICWLMLHNFDSADVQIPKSELMGSQLPVYIV